MDIRFQTGHEPKAKFCQGERSAAEKIIGLLGDYGTQMRSTEHDRLALDLQTAFCDMGLLPHSEVAEDKTP